MFAPWISWLLLLESSPIVPPATLHYKILWLVFVIPVVILDVKIYGQWFTKGKMFLSMVANPTSQMSVIGNLVAAQVASRFPGNNKIPAMLRPVFFLFFAAPSMASLAWHSICGYYDTASKMLFFLSLFLFLSL
ncbi:S-type anion channel SLAH1-like protein, partial [Trifolium pratense]